MAAGGMKIISSVSRKSAAYQWRQRRINEKRKSSSIEAAYLFVAAWRYRAGGVSSGGMAIMAA